MARRQSHKLQVLRIPSTKNNPSIIRIILELMNDFRELVNTLSCVVCLSIDVLGAKVPPLEAINRTEVAHCAMGEADRVEIFARSVPIPDLDACGGQGE